MEFSEEIDRSPFPADATTHPIVEVHHIAHTQGENMENARKTAQILWLTVLTAHHLEPSATSFSDFKDDPGAQSSKKLLFLLMQAARINALDTEVEVEGGDPGETKRGSEPLPVYESQVVDGEEVFNPTRKIFVEQLFALSDPTQKIGYRFAFCLFTKKCDWSDLIFQAIRNNERRMSGRSRPKPEAIKLNPQWDVCNLERFASLVCDYLGNSDGLYRTINGSLHSTFTISSPNNKAYPPRVFSFKNSCKNLERFNTGDGTVSLSVLHADEHPMVAQTLEGNYVRTARRSRVINVAIIFPNPDVVWEIDSPYWSMSALHGVLLPGFETSEMTELANQMRKCRISVNDASGRLGSDIASELLQISLEEQGQNAQESLSAAVIYDNSQSASSAMFGIHSRIDVSSLSAKEQFRLTSAIVRIRDDNKRVVEEFRRGNFTKEEFDEKYAAYREKSVRIVERDVMVKNNKRLSRAERAVVNYFLAYTADRASSGLAFVDEDFVMPVSDPSLTPAANYIKALMDEKENNGMSTFHVPDLILWTGLNDSWRYGTGMHMNFALTGKHGAGKSYLQSRVLSRSVPGVCTNVMHETGKAAMTGGNRNGEINLIEELPPWMFGNVEGQGTETGDPTLKARLTQAIISVVYFHHDKETGDRVRKIIYAMAMSTTCAATNEEWYQMPDALRDRFWHITAPKFKRMGWTPADRITMGDISAFNFGSDIEDRRCQLEQCLIAITEWLIATNSICVMTGDVNMAVFHQISRHHYASLTKMGINASNVRQRERVLYLARTLTIRMAIYWLFFQPLAKYRLKNVFDIHQFAIDVEMLLVCTEEITNFAFELAASQFVDPSVGPVISCVAGMTKFTEEAASGNSTEAIQFFQPTANRELTSHSGSLPQTAVQLIRYTPARAVFADGARVAQSDDAIPGERQATRPKDYNYVQLTGSLALVADNIAAQIAHKNVSLAPADIRSVLRSLSKLRFSAAQRNAPDNGGEGSSSGEAPAPVASGPKELMPVVVIDEFEKKVKILCAFMESTLKNTGRNLVEEMISNYKHPKQASYDTLSITSITDFPNLLPRRCVRPNTETEYRAAGGRFLTTFNPNAIDRAQLASRGLLHTTPTPWRMYYEAFDRRFITFTRFSPETEVIAWWLTMTGHNPTDLDSLKAFPEGQRAYQRVASLAKMLLDADATAAITAHQSGATYERKFANARQAACEAQRQEFDKTIEHKPTYPIDEIVDRTKVLVRMVHQTSEDPTREIGRIRQSFKDAVTRSGMLHLLGPESEERLAVSFDTPSFEGTMITSSRFDSVLPALPASSSSSMRLLKRGRDDDPVEGMYGCVPKQQHLLTGTIDRSIEYENQLSREQARRRHEAEAALARVPAPVVESSSAELLSTFGNLRPLEAPRDTHPTLGMDLNDIMQAEAGMVTI